MNVASISLSIPVKDALILSPVKIGSETFVEATPVITDNVSSIVGNVPGLNSADLYEPSFIETVATAVAVGKATVYCKVTEKATNEVLGDGWLFTGDMAQEDEDGFIFLVDRKKDVIISGGENLYPVQIEDFIRTNDKVHDVAVIGLAHARLGEIPAAIIELKEGMSMTKEEMDEYCLKLPRYKRPREVIFADIPRNPTGKIEKPKLREMYGANKLIADQNLG